MVIACARADSACEGPQQQVTCLAGLTWELALIPLLLGAASVELRHGACAACPLGPDVSQALDQIRARTRTLQGPLGIGNVTAIELARTTNIPQGGAPPRGRRLSRRDLFGSLTARAQTTLADTTTAMLQGQAVDGLRHPGAWLRDIIAALLRRRRDLLRASTIQGFAIQPTISERRCTGCGICASACPTGALACPAAEEARPRVLGILHRCLGCGACVRACPESAIDLAGETELQQWAMGACVVLAAPRRRCRSCASDEVLPGLDLCGPCKRSEIMMAG